MKSLLTSGVILFIILGCRKNDIQIIRGKLVKCDVAEQSPVLVGYLVGNGFKKTYYEDGLVKTLLTKMNSAFGDFDSIQYNFTYTGKIVKVSGIKLNYQYHSDGNGGDIHYTNDFPPEHYDFDVTFDPKTLNAIKAGSTIFKYNKLGRLLSYDDFALEYDNKGNIIKINKDFGGSLIFTYDYSKSAKQQLYYTTGFMTNEMYNLMEIMGWIPVEPNNLRLSHSLFIETDLFFGEFFFLDHVVNEDGILTSFRESFDSDKVAPPDFPPIINTWKCEPIRKLIKDIK